MTMKPQQDLGGPVEQRGPVSASPPEPHWMSVRMTVNKANEMGEGPRILYRGQMYDVDLNEPWVIRQLQATWMVPLPANQQPQEASE